MSCKQFQKVFKKENVFEKPLTAWVCWQW